MSVRNKMVKGFFYVLLTIGTIIQSYAIGLVFSGAGLAFIEAVWSVIRPLPEFFTTKAWLVYLISGIPTGVAVFTYTAINVIQSQLEKNNKQGNGN